MMHSFPSPAVGQFVIPQRSLTAQSMLILGMAGDDDQPPWGGEGEHEGDGALATQTEKKVKKPRLYRVLLHNDDYTTMEFVVLVLTKVFHHNEAEAVRIMLHVHNNGVGVAGVFSYEIAETKANKVAQLAREHQYPLRCTVEPA